MTRHRTLPTKLRGMGGTYVRNRTLGIRKLASLCIDQSPGEVSDAHVAYVPRPYRAGSVRAISIVRLSFILDEGSAIRCVHEQSDRGDSRVRPRDRGRGAFRAGDG